jgi:phage-related tail fiber protein
MPNLIQIKRSATTATPPTLATGELAWSELTKTLFIGESGSVVTAAAGSGVFARKADSFAVSGDATGTGTLSGGVILALAASGATAGSYSNVTVDAKGRVTGGSNPGYLTANQNITVSGDATGSGTTVIALTLASSGVTAGTYNNAATAHTPFTVDAKGRITATGTAVTVTPAWTSITGRPTTLSGYGITDALALVGGTLTGALTLAADPTTALQAATKQYVDNAITGLDFKQSVRATTTANITLSGTQTIDGVALIAGDRVLVKDQTTSNQNGIYFVAAGSWSRASDADNSPAGEVSAGMYAFIEEGTTYASSGWVLATANPITLGTTALTFQQFNGLGQLTAGTGLTKSGNTLSITASGVTAGTYSSMTVDVTGRVTAGTNPGYITANQNITVSGDVTGSGTTSMALTLAASGVTAGTYNNSATAVSPITVDAKGRVTAIGTAVTVTPAWTSVSGKPTTLSGFGITDALSTSATIDGGSF